MARLADELCITRKNNSDELSRGARAFLIPGDPFWKIRCLFAGIIRLLREGEERTTGNCLQIWIVRAKRSPTGGRGRA